MFQSLALLPVDWRRVHLFWVDERCVPPDDAASNYKTGEGKPDRSRAHSGRQRPSRGGEIDPTKRLENTRTISGSSLSWQLAKCRGLT